MKKRTVFLFGGICSLLGAGGLLIYMRMNYTIFPEELKLEHLSKLAGIYSLVESQHIKETKEKTLINGAIEGMLQSTGDAHTYYYPAEEKEDSVSERLGSSYYGVGLEVSENNDIITVMGVYKEAPAYKAGILPYDILYKINGKKITNTDINEVVKKIKGKKGTYVTLTVLREGVKEPFDVKIMRDEISIRTVTHKEIYHKEKRVGYIEIRSFSEKTAEEFKTALRKLEEDPLDGLIIDVRGNGGGYLDAVEEIGDLLLPQGKIVFQMENKGEKPVSYRSKGKQKKSYPIATLIDEGSASASEVLAAALRENENYPVIGQTSYGKGSVQTLYPLFDQSEIKITTAKWLTPKGNWIDQKGIKPDVSVKQPKFFFQPLISVKKPIVLDTVNTNTVSMQQILRAVGYEPKRTDGYFDISTEQALKAYQRDHQLPQTGILDEKTAVALNRTMLEERDNPKQDVQLAKAMEEILQEKKKPNSLDVFKIDNVLTRLTSE